jgi:hypothetical protein
MKLIQFRFFLKYFLDYYLNVWVMFMRRGGLGRVWVPS